jgi:PleD family two-component response regulator
MLLNDISGLDLLEQLQGSDVLADASIIAFTASDDQKLKDRSLELGASEFFYKPETGIDELFSSVLKHLAQ